MQNAQFTLGRYINWRDILLAAILYRGWSRWLDLCPKTGLPLLVLGLFQRYEIRVCKLLLYTS